MLCRHRAVAASSFASWLFLGLLYWVASTSPLLAQAKDSTPAPDNERAAPVPQKIDISPTAGDDEIRMRLQEIVEAPGWFPSSQVIAKQGVVFLSGQARTDELKQWTISPPALGALGGTPAEFEDRIAADPARYRALAEQIRVASNVA